MTPRILLICALIAFGCSSAPKVSRIDSDSATDLSGGWNDTDSRLVSNTMVQNMLKESWLADWQSGHDAKPVVVVGRIRNNTIEHIAVGAFIADIEREMINSGSVAFAAGGADRDDARRERLDQMQNASDETIKDFGKEIGADFMLFGSIGSFVDEVNGRRVVAYQTDLYLVDIEKNLKVWAGQERIKKLITRRKLSL
jgi:uncharacterized protein (TIGR02722 family)